MNFYIRCAVVCLASLGLMLSSGLMAGKPPVSGAAEPIAAASAAAVDATAMSEIIALKPRAN